jgi:hypothetical protein
VGHVPLSGNFSFSYRLLSSGPVARDTDGLLLQEIMERELNLSGVNISTVLTEHWNNFTVSLVLQAQHRTADDHV